MQNRILLVIRGNRVDDLEIEGLVFNYFRHRIDLKVKNTTKETVEYIYELTKKEYEKSLEKDDSIIDKLYKLPAVEYVNIVVQNEQVKNFIEKNINILRTQLASGGVNVNQIQNTQQINNNQKKAKSKSNKGHNPSNKS